MRKLILVAVALTLALSISTRWAHSQESRLRYLGSVTMKVGLVDKMAPIMKEKYNIIIDADASGSTGVGIQEVINGKADVVGSGGNISKDAIAKGIVATLIGSDILAVAINTGNPVKGLTKEQLKGIFAGKITNWSEVGGKDARIVVFTMDTISAGYEIFKEVVLEKGSFGEKVVPMRIPLQVAQNINKVPDAIGFCPLAFIQREPNARILAVDGQEPSPTNPRYPLTRPLYWGTRGAPTGNVKVLIDFLLSEEGQAIVKQSFVGVRDTQKTAAQ